MNRTDVLVERDAALLSDTLKVRFFPLVIERAEGCRIWDISGREYLDFMAGWAVANTGYGNPEIKKAVFDQLDKVSFATLTAFMSEASIELADQLLKVVPGRGERKVWFGLSGSDASDAVAKLVPLAQKRPRMVSYIGGYHGQTGGSAALSGHTAQSRVMSGNVVKVPYPNPYRCPLGHEDPATCGKACLSYVEDYVFRTICPPEDVAGLIVEAVQSDGGDIVPPDGYLQGVQALCRKHGILFILDEVKIGFGRTGKMWGFEHSGLEPDVVVLGKAMGSGFSPISAVVAPAEVLDLAPAINMYTTAGSPAAATAGLATLKYIQSHDLIGNARLIGDRLLAGFKELQKHHPLIGDARGRGMILGIELVKDRKTKEPAAKEAAKVAYRAFELGLIVFYGGIYSNVLEITPPLTMTPQEADQGIAILDQALRDVESGSFPDEKLGRYAGW
jgi:4-aminobutyrate aminotransferase